MRVFYGLDNLPQFSNAVATMGSFDGVHGGHRVLLERVKARARSMGGESVVLTFNPHPRYVLGTAEGMQLLSTLDEKILLLERMGIDNLVVIPFTVEFSRTSPEEFIKRTIASIGVRWLIVGYNHRFGYRKQGDYKFLEECGEGLNIEMVEQQQIAQSKVSSTVIRRCVEQGDMAEAAQLLSHPYIVLCSAVGNGCFKPVDCNKLLPPAGEYKANIEGRVVSLVVKADGELQIDGCELENISDKIVVEIG
jgi:riboflavin kinase/FMN adenylyltransferase